MHSIECSVFMYDRLAACLCESHPVYDQVKSMGEHIVLYVLNRIVYRTREMEPGGGAFLLHSSEDIASVMWLDGEAVGFYTITAKGKQL